MNIGIIGYGVIGKAVGDTFTSGNVYIYDVKDIVDKGENVIVTNSIPELVSQNAEIIFLCVPSPTINGKFIDSYITQVLDDITGLDNVPPIVLKSTVPPDVLDVLFEKYADVLTIYNPEFLRQNCAKQDLLDMEKQYVYATSDKNYDAFKAYIDNSDCNKEIERFQSYKKLSLFKYASNSFNATRVIFANCIYQLFTQMRDYEIREDEMSFEEFIDLFGEFIEMNKKRWGHNLRVPGPDGNFGYGGACLPKDVQALIEYSYNNDCPESFLLFSAIEKINKAVRQ